MTHLLCFQIGCILTVWFGPKKDETFSMDQFIEMFKAPLFLIISACLLALALIDYIILQCIGCRFKESDNILPFRYIWFLLPDVITSRIKFVDTIWPVFWKALITLIFKTNFQNLRGASVMPNKYHLDIPKIIEKQI